MWLTIRKDFFLLLSLNNVFLRYYWASSRARHCVIHLRCRDEFIHWGMKGRQKRAYDSIRCKGQRPKGGEETVVAVAHPWGMGATWEPLGLRFTEKGVPRELGTHPKRHLSLQKQSGRHTCHGFDRRVCESGLQNCKWTSLFNKRAEWLVSPVFLPHMYVHISILLREYSEFHSFNKYVLDAYDYRPLGLDTTVNDLQSLFFRSFQSGKWKTGKEWVFQAKSIK